MGALWVAVFPTCVAGWSVTGGLWVTVSVLMLQDDTMRISASNSSIATSLLDDTSPETAVGKKSKPSTWIDEFWHSSTCRLLVNSVVLVIDRLYVLWLSPYLCVVSPLLVISALMCVHFLCPPTQLHPCSFPFPQLPSQRDVKHPSGGTPSKRRPPRVYGSFIPPTRQSSKSLVSDMNSVPLSHDLRFTKLFCFWVKALPAIIFSWNWYLGHNYAKIL